MLRPASTPELISEVLCLPISPGARVSPFLASRRGPSPPQPGLLPADKQQRQAGWESFRVLCRGTGFWGRHGLQTRGAGWFGKGQSLLQSQAAGKEGVSILHFLA